MGEEPSSRKTAPRCRRVVVLGATGSIGTSAVKVARDIPDRMKIVGLAAHRSFEPMARQMEDLGVRHGALYDPAAAEALRESTKHLDASIGAGEEGLVELAQLPEADMVLIAIVGTAGLRPALAAIEAGKAQNT